MSEQSKAKEVAIAKPVNKVEIFELSQGGQSLGNFTKVPAAKAAAMPNIVRAKTIKTDKEGNVTGEKFDFYTPVS